MLEIIREFVVQEAARGRFELLYGPGGAWGQLLAHAPGFRGITLLRDAANWRRYLMVEVWDSAAHRERALAANRAGCDSLNATLADWCEMVTDVGTFALLAQTAVRPTRGAR